MFKMQGIKAAGLVSVVLPVLLGGVQTVSAQEKSGFNIDVLLEKNIELSGAKINTQMIRVAFPYGFKTPWHTHEGPGPRYITKGTLKVTEGGKTNTYSVGEVFWETGELMAVENVGDGAAELIIFELAPVK